MAKEYERTFGDAARIHSKVGEECEIPGLPWDSIFGSMGDEESPMRKAAIAAWNATLFSQEGILAHGEIRYEAHRPVIPLSLAQAADWFSKNKETALSLREVEQISGFCEDLFRAYGSDCRVVDLTILQNGKYHVAPIRDLMLSRHINEDENFGPNDVVIIRLDPPGRAIQLTSLGTNDLPVFEVVEDVSFGELHYQLRRCGCGLASDSEFLETEYAFPDANVFVRGDLKSIKYSRYNGLKEFQGHNDSDDVIILKGGYVIGKRIEGCTKHAK